MPPSAPLARSLFPAFLRPMTLLRETFVRGVPVASLPRAATRARLRLLPHGFMQRAATDAGFRAPRHVSRHVGLLAGALIPPQSVVRMPPP
ncbi:hypothetical protein SETIT_4G064900v2 [Setaria italica]|uniref:Uncharacterized protein n=2 Tax=Setaria TaxID=4554 RepID=A0A368QRE8_SETIT|nr:hypothetical protein SETIT_4G064900v2 [Setaria italica]